MHMQKNKFLFPTLAVLAFVAAVGTSSWILPGTIIPLQQVLPTSTPIAMTPTEDILNSDTNCAFVQWTRRGINPRLST
jgi:hypothetical protein